MKELVIIVAAVYISGYFSTFILAYNRMYSDYIDINRPAWYPKLDWKTFKGLFLFSLFSWFGLFLISLILIGETVNEYNLKRKPEKT